MRRSATIFSVFVLLAVIIGGCASASSGKKIDQDNTAKIIKGSTTRAELEQMFGTPTNVAMMPDGGRQLMWNYAKTHVNAANPWYTKHNTRQQMLQVVLGPNGVVKDFEFSDNTTTGSSHAYGGSTSKTTPTNSQAAPDPDHTAPQSGDNP